MFSVASPKSAETLRPACGFCVAVTSVFLAALALMLGAGARAGTTPTKTYKNERYGYEIRYPQAWFPSGIVYGNAFEIRNYQPRRPQLRTPRNRAKLLFVEMPMESRVDADRFLDGLVAQGSNSQRKVRALTIDSRRAVRVTQRIQEQVLGPGVGGPAPKRATVLHIKTFVANGAFVLQLWGVVRVDASEGVIVELIRIENNVRFS